MSDIATQLGVGGVFAILVIRTVLVEWRRWQEMQQGKRTPISVRPPSGKGRSMSPVGGQMLLTNEMQRHMGEVHKIVSSEDASGAPRIYQRDTAEVLRRVESLITTVLECRRSDNSARQSEHAEILTLIRETKLRMDRTR